MTNNKQTTYAESGVNIDAGNKAVNLIKNEAQKTFRHYNGKILSGIGGFSGVIELADKRVMGTSTDGVGTKLMLSIIMEKHDTVGIDLVAMCVNDLIVAGITPAIFLDYIAMGKQIPKRTSLIVKGIIEGCERAETALLGGEMAEMPGMYKDNDYDLAGFAIGFADSKENLILGKDIKPGMKVFGLPSSGVHSNGYSLARKVFGIDINKPKKAKKILDKQHSFIGKTLGEELLEPTTIYVKQIKSLLSKYKIAGMVHITGGGIIENPPRVLPKGCAINIKMGSWPVNPIFKYIQKKGNISIKEMLKTFNYGIGLMVISDDDIKQGIPIGKVVKGNKEVRLI
ncbi:phosphoribosylformylglycinamidine cyclo-ligase [Candidatus Parcubacteria bacterium]|nr:phosphoribosylformylglycinamidine cyclo-ligase [Candidatus Parcubacteria bacterium]